LRSIDTALGIAVQRSNKGSTAHLDFLVELELLCNRSTEEYVEQADLTRVKTATRKSSEREKRKRQRVETARHRERAVQKDEAWRGRCMGQEYSRL
jgi:hypothetical protein